MGKPYCCFVDPKKSYEDHELADPCPTCGRRYDFPLVDFPESILGYRVVRPMGRGFYGATYVAERGRLRRSYVLKVVPVSVYEVFGKDFSRECTLHEQVARGVDHVVPIVDYDRAALSFGDVEIDCHVAVMDHVEGEKLSDFARSATAASLAQIASDLFRLLAELDDKEQYHNDLHDENIIIARLPPGSRRADAVDETIRAVAVDLGSIADRSKSGDRLSDWHAIAKHLFSFVDRLLARPDEASDVDYRLAAQLEEIGEMLKPEALKQRVPDFDYFARLIRDAVVYASSPWRPPGPLQRFKDAYNAQTLHWWFVPRLLVDPEDQWLPAVSRPGPQLITGMRGCGKTMLLRALQFHARASSTEEDPEKTVRRLEDDRYVGVYVSCTRLLDKLGTPVDALHEPYARLYVAYAREAVRAARQLREVKPSLLAPGYHRGLGQAVAEYLRHGEDLRQAETEIELERRLQLALVSLSRGESRHTLEAHPTVAFPHLADAIRTCSPIWSDATVLFLLDDVSTRHLGMSSIGELLSSLLFQSDVCAFKMTTETQTLYEVLRSPGLIEKARLDRDYEVFDLGGAVNKHLSPPGGKEFISSILAQRAGQYPRHPMAAPADLLGDVSLEQIARQIRSVSEASRAKKTVYRGVRALTAVCVGDIGDVISIYDSMLREATRRDASRIDPAIQSSCFQDYCSRRLYHLNRRDGRLKDFALSFAEAAHELLKSSSPDRLRQYTKIYVRLTTGSTDSQFGQIRELIDSGVFVFAGGADAPRTKTRDSDPIHQFVLTYRKLFGLSSFIGLSDRDRFELSGADLEDWLAHPENGREILLRNLTGSRAEVDSAEAEGAEDEDASGGSAPRETPPEPLKGQLPLFEAGVPPSEAPEPDVRRSAEGGVRSPPALARVPRARLVATEDLGSAGIDALVVGMGFELRSLESTKRVLAIVRPRRAALVRYREPGHGEEIERLVRDGVDEVITVDYEDVLEGGFELAPGPVLVDVSGLAKPVLFHSVIRALRRDRRVWIAHTTAERHYPLSEDIRKVLDADRERDPYALLAALDEVWSGEKGPYEFDRLLHTDADESRRRLLLASASPKHQRLLSLLDERDYDRIDIVAPKAATPRGDLARLAADVACRGMEASQVEEVDSNDLEGVIELLAEHYQRWYVRGGYDFELGLTGSKLHAVAFAAACAVLRISQCWYVRPREFDPKRFAHGVDETRFFVIEMPE